MFDMVIGGVTECWMLILLAEQMSIDPVEVHVLNCSCTRRQDAGVCGIVFK